MISQTSLKKLANTLNGELHFDKKMRSLYATDASIYRQLPLAVAYPKNNIDLVNLIAFANQNKTSLIPRTAGTSLAGQCVGDGIVVDVSKYFTDILELNVAEKWVRLQPGVVRDELNAFLEPHGLFFGPNTSTANRCMIGGMVGNNSSGTTSIKYGVTRDHVLELNTLLADGTAATFTAVAEVELQQKQNLGNKESKIYSEILELLNEPGAREDIENHFPKKEIHRRNTGYALDELVRQQNHLDLTKLLTGSEGTLAFTTEIKLNLSPLPPKKVALVCAHFQSIGESLNATLTMMKAKPYACELMDKIILDCTKNNIEQQENRFFVEGDPAAIVVAELRSDTHEDLEIQIEKLILDLKNAGLGYAYTKVEAPDVPKVWALRSAGLGLLSNIPGDAKPIACIEDTAVVLEDLPAYIDEFERLMKTFDQRAVYYAHAGAGELHLRPILNLKDPNDLVKFRQICEASAKLVKKYNGSLSGEHGDGRVRAEFIPMMVGPENYQRLLRVKQIWDPNNIFNPGKIVHALPIDQDLRFSVTKQDPQLKTFLDFSENDGLLRAAEKCNGSGDCRKITGAMCPSYQATKNETTTTRARANMLREVITEYGDNPLPLANKDLKEVLDLCVSCKACKRECPSNVDMALMKAEFLHQYQQKNGLDFRSKMFGASHEMNKKGMIAPGIANFFLKNALTGGLIKKVLGVAPQRSLPELNKISFKKWFAQQKFKVSNNASALYLFVDEFIDFNELELGKKTVQLLFALGFEVKVLDNQASGRTYFSKGMLEQAKQCAQSNVALFSKVVSPQTPLVGIEPSAILSFRDEYVKLLSGQEQMDAKVLAKNCFTLEEFLDREHHKKSLTHFFTDGKKDVEVHVHCHQKALSKQEISKRVLNIPENYTTNIIASSCCGMAGSFGYEKEHYETSMQMGELKLFPAVRRASAETVIAAAGTSCRHQIKDGTKKQALHPAEILYNALK